MPKKIFIDKDLLYKDYIVCEKSTHTIGKEYNKTHTTILNWLKKYNIPRRTKQTCQIGKKLSKETKQKISDSNLGKKAWNKGKKSSKETREKIRKANINRNYEGSNHQNVQIVIKNYRLMSQKDV